MRLSPHALHLPVVWGRMLRAVEVLRRGRDEDEEGRGLIVCICDVIGRANVAVGVGLGDCIVSCVDDCPLPLLGPSVSAYNRYSVK